MRQRRELKLVCQHCEERFTNRYFKLFCSETCYESSLASRLRKHLWTDVELDYLKKICGHLNAHEALLAFKEWDVKGLEDRQIIPMITKVKTRLKGKTLQEWAEVLSLPKSTLYTWVSTGGLTTTSWHGEVFVSLYHMKRFLVDNYPQIPLDEDIEL